MSFFDYNLNIPAANNNPSDDQPLMQTNTNSISDWTLVDHKGFQDVDDLGGYHTDVHLVSQGTAPADIPVGLNPLLVGQLLNLQVTTTAFTPETDTQLFHVTSNGGVSQLTGDAAQAEGYQWVGGNLIQWGKRPVTPGSWPTSDQTLTFQSRQGTTNTFSFPNNCFAVITTFIGPTSSSTGDITINSISSTNFHWQFSGSSSAGFGGFYWVAIGN